jgi:homoserine kinase
VANLGSGFDVLALAVDLWLEVEAEPARAPDWTFEGEGAEQLAATPNVFSREPMRGVVRNRIPIGVGLGSSAAARLALGALRGMDVERALRWAVAEEGHPDNVAAAAHGGVRLLAAGEVGLPTPDLDVAMLVAREPASTDAARALLAPQVSLADAVFNAGRTALLVHSLHSRDYALLREAMADRLHQPRRRSLYPWTAEVMAAALAAGAHGAAISGAGPSVFALCPRGTGRAVAGAMAAAAPDRGSPLVTEVARAGMSILR